MSAYTDTAAAAAALTPGERARLAALLEALQRADRYAADAARTSAFRDEALADAAALSTDPAEEPTA